MRALHVINVRWFNATAWYAFRLAKGAVSAGDEAAVAGLPGSPVIEEAKKASLPVLEAEFNANGVFAVRRTARAAEAFLKDYDPDVVACHRGEMFWWFALYKFFKKPRWKLIRVRGDARPPTEDALSRFMHNRCASAVIASSEKIRRRFTERLETPPEKAHVVYGGVDTSVFRYDAEAGRRIRAEFGYSPDDYVVSVVGRFDPVKGHDVFLKACSILYREGMRNLKVLLVGFPENIKIPDMERMIRENGLEEITAITGRRSDVADLMNACDLGVVSSLGSEAVCRVAMEFMACRVPVVASDAGVLPEMLPGVNIYPMNDAGALARKILNHKNFRKVYSEREFYSQFKKICENA